MSGQMRTMARTTTRIWKAHEVLQCQRRKVQALIPEGSRGVESPKAPSSCTQPLRCGLTGNVRTPFEAE
jgi:hypothetical protein